MKPYVKTTKSEFSYAYAKKTSSAVYEKNDKYAYSYYFKHSHTKPKYKDHH